MQRLLIVIPFIIFIISCDKSDNAPKDIVLDTATYTGTFQRTGVPGSSIANVSLTLSDRHFNGQSNMPRYPAICNGTFQLSGDSIQFINACVFTADFDWTLILSGKYDIYTIDDQLIITRTYNNQVKDVYNLRKAGSN